MANLGQWYVKVELERKDGPCEQNDKHDIGSILKVSQLNLERRQSESITPIGKAQVMNEL